MIVTLLLAWIAFSAFAISGLAWLERRRSGPVPPGAPLADAAPAPPPERRHPPRRAHLAPAAAAPTRPLL